MKSDWAKTLTITFLVLLAAFSRLAPHPSNFTAIGALAIFAAAIIPNKFLSSLLPLAAMWLSDLAMNNLVYREYYPSFVWFSPGFFWIYAGVFAHNISAWFTIKKVNITSVSGTSVLGATFFFILSNFGVWLGSGRYPTTSEGLLRCYVAALPFFGNMLVSNLFFCTLLFGAHYFLERKIKVLETA